MEFNRKEKFKESFQKHYARLCCMAYSYVADEEDAEDIVQELFINIWEKEKDLLPDKEFAAYITVAVRNSCLTFLRKRQNGPVSIEDYSTIASAVPDDSHDAESVSPEDLLQAALATLPVKCREIFLMAKLKGMRYREIANGLGISEKTVENQMSKAIKMLRDYAMSNSSLLVTVVAIVLLFVINCM